LIKFNSKYKSDFDKIKFEIQMSSDFDKTKFKIQNLKNVISKRRRLYDILIKFNSKFKTNLMLFPSLGGYMLNKEERYSREP